MGVPVSWTYWLLLAPVSVVTLPPVVDAVHESASASNVTLVPRARDDDSTVSSGRPSLHAAESESANRPKSADGGADTDFQGPRAMGLCMNSSLLGARIIRRPAAADRLVVEAQLMRDAVRYEARDRIGVITLDRPDNRNSMTPELLDA